MAAYDIDENLINCRNCIYQYYDPETDFCRCSRHGGRICGDENEKDICRNRIPRLEPMPWTGFRMIERLMDETLADDEELMIFLGIGTARAVEFAARDDDPEVLKRSIVMRDAVQRIFTEKENYRK